MKAYCIKIVRILNTEELQLSDISEPAVGRIIRVIIYSIFFFYNESNRVESNCVERRGGEENREEKNLKKAKLP